ncbi:ATP-binding protein [Bacillus cereus]|uniref:ATP-binding protein n=1 Tax=Bacillus cereus TaxID=1396 RepID=UPI000BEE55CD|nr:ATP-binding protein [Bacillus cereus]PDY83597.1 hypothetical protein CON06_08035 [Bacillus cereus]PFH80431.1 hypothetical protein COI61_03800 [Bacillus cereus]
MKISLKHHLISDSPYEMGVKNEIFIPQDKELFEQIVLEIVNGNPASFLISGYRGAGKTSFINKIKERCVQKDSNILFISLNFGKYEEFSLILRKIIREVYLAIDNKEIVINTEMKSSLKNVKEQLEKDNPSLLRELELIYERTFYQVTENRKQSLQTEKSISQTITYDIKKAVMSVGLLIATGISNEFKFIEKILGLNNTNLDKVVLIASAIWAGIASYNLTLSYSKKRTELDELSRSSLYDNEIAEFQLKKILNGLKRSGLKMVFVIDEVDKIDNDEKLNSLISELKPLMLSGLASFVLISGQKLYYKYQASHTIDDAIISSVFSKTIHIPLLSIKKFEELFQKILEKESDFSNALLQDYINSKILQSNRLPRRFINLIRQNLIWEEKTSYITINKDTANALKTDTQLLEVIKEIEAKNINEEKFDGGIKDFLITQLHIWTQKIKLNRYVSFTLHDIYDLEQYSKEVHSSWYLTLLNKLALQLLDNLAEIGLLEKENKEIEEETRVFYKWKDDAEVIVDELVKFDDGRWIFMDNFIKLEKMIRGINIQLLDSYLNNQSFKMIIRKLYQNNVIDRNAAELIYNLDTLKKKISHGKELGDGEASFVINSQQSFNQAETMLIEQIYYYVIKQHMSKTQMQVIDEQLDMDNPFKFILGLRYTELFHLCFKVKLLQKASSYYNYIRKTLIDYQEYIVHNPHSYLVLLIYSQKDDTYQEKFIRDFKEIIDNEYNELSEYIILFSYSESNHDKLKQDMDLVLQKLTHEHINIV